MEDTTAMEVDDEALDTREMVKYLPLQYETTPPANNVYVVRKCYPEYYDLIVARLKQGVRVVTVTGTPGIGKSIFMSYFFERYKQEHMDSTLVVASHDKLGNMKKVVVWTKEVSEDEGPSHQQRNVNLMDGLILEAETLAEKENRECIHLYDGAPGRLIATTAIVCFTSPKEEWFSITKKGSHVNLYMPLWTLTELKQTAHKLDLHCDGIPLSDETIAQRFEFFGGEARYCLGSNSEMVLEHVTDIHDAVATIHSCSKLEDMMFAKANEYMRHRLIHCVPDVVQKVGFNYFKRKVASPQIELLLLRALSAQLLNGKGQLMAWLKGIPAGASFHGFLFESVAHETFVLGKTVSARLLCGRAAPSRTFEVEASNDFCYFGRDYSLSSLITSGPYHLPENKNFSSIDSFYIPSYGSAEEAREAFEEPDFCLLMFQMTEASQHPVKGVGIAKLLKRLSLVATVKAHPTKAVLIFVVPEGKGEHFGSQQIVLPVGGDGALVSTISGIGSSGERELRKSGVLTVGDLKAAVAQDECGQFKSCLKDHELVVEMSAALGDIPQYVWELSMH